MKSHIFKIETMPMNGNKDILLRFIWSFEDYKWWEAGSSPPWPPSPPHLGPSTAMSTFSLISLCLDLSQLNLPEQLKWHLVALKEIPSTFAVGSICPWYRVDFPNH